MAQTQEKGFAKSSQTTQPADDVCSQRLEKTLDALDKSESLNKSLQTLIDKQSQILALDDQIIRKKDETIKSQDDLIKIYQKRPKTELSFFWVIKFKKY